MAMSGLDLFNLREKNYFIVKHREIIFTLGTRVRSNKSLLKYLNSAKLILARLILYSAAAATHTKCTTNFKGVSEATP